MTDNVVDIKTAKPREKSPRLVTYTSPLAIICSHCEGSGCNYFGGPCYTCDGKGYQ